MKVQLLILIEAFGASEKKIDINFSKAKTNFFFSLHYNADNSYLFVNGKEIYNFNASNLNITFHLNFIFEACLMNFCICMIFQMIMVLLINLTF